MNKLHTIFTALTISILLTPTTYAVNLSAEQYVIYVVDSDYQPIYLSEGACLTSTYFTAHALLRECDNGHNQKDTVFNNKNKKKHLNLPMLIPHKFSQKNEENHIQDHQIPPVSTIVLDKKVAPVDTPPSLKKIALAVPIFFNDNESTLRTSSRKTVDHLIITMQTKIELDIIIVSGYADCLDNTSSSIALSEQRAETVKNYLLSYKIPAHIIYVEGNGGEHLAAAENITGDPQLRRVEIEIIGHAYEKITPPTDELPPEDTTSIATVENTIPPKFQQKPGFVAKLEITPTELNMTNATDTISYEIETETISHENDILTGINEQNNVAEDSPSQLEEMATAFTIANTVSQDHIAPPTS